MALTLDQEGIYCVTAKGTLAEQSYNLETEAFTSIETPIIAPVCVVTVTGTAVPESVVVYSDRVATEVRSSAAYTAAAEAGTELTVSGGTITLASGTVVGSATLTKMEVYTQGDYAAASIVSAVQNGNSIDVILADTTNPAAALQIGLACTGGVVNLSGNKCTLNAGQGTAVQNVPAL